MTKEDRVVSLCTNRERLVDKVKRKKETKIILENVIEKEEQTGVVYNIANGSREPDLDGVIITSPGKRITNSYKGKVFKTNNNKINYYFHKILSYFI